MKDFNVFQPVEVKFGCRRINEIGEVVSKIGERCILVSGPISDYKKPILAKIQEALTNKDVELKYFHGVVQNPTTDSVTSGAEMAREFKAEVVIGLGGGSSIDSAKTIAVEATHSGNSWDYLFYKETQPTEKTLPIIAIPTTSGTGSHINQAAAISNTKEKRKSGIGSPYLFPKVSIVDPELMLTLPEHITASTGFDVFAHSFETYIHKNASPYTDLVAIEAIRLVIENLPKLIRDGSDLEARSQMAWADTLAGFCLANVGVGLPHSLGMAIGGCCPHVMHGKALALVYPEFIRYTYSSSVKKFANLARLFDKNLENESDDIAAERSSLLLDDFLNVIKIGLSLKKLEIPETELEEIAEKSMELPDYTNNPRIANLEEINNMLKSIKNKN